MADSAKDYQRSLDEIGSQIDSISRNLNANKALLKTERDRLLETEKKLSQQQQSLQTINLKIDQSQSEIERLEAELKLSIESQKESREALKKLIQGRHKTGEFNYLKLFLNQQNPYAAGRLNNYHDYFSQALRAKYADLKEQLDDTEKLKSEQQKVLTKLTKQQQRATTLAEKLKASKKARAKTVASLGNKVGITTKKLKTLREDRARLKALLTQIAKQAAELERIEKQRARQAKQAADRARAANIKRPAEQKPVVRQAVKGGFVKQRGRLQYPVKNKASVRYGSRLAESGMRSEGMFFETKTSVSVNSIFRGRVLFADFLKGYGLLIIVDHGDDHISLYGHNEVLYKKVGDSVQTNELIAKTGVTGGLKSAGLYFEIRQNASPVDPSAWCQ